MVRLPAPVPSSPSVSETSVSPVLRLICAVRDCSDASPVEGEADFSAESGRGLYLVDSFSDSWGWHRLEDAAHGKVVWALFDLPRIPAQATAPASHAS